MSQISSTGSGGGGSGIIETIAGDTGSITGANVTIFANAAALNSGNTVQFNNTGTVSTFNVTDADDNTTIGRDSGIAAALAQGNTSIGTENLTAMTTAAFNVFVGNTAGRDITEGARNVGFGVGALSLCDVGNENVAIGGNALLQVTSSNANCAVGTHALEDLMTGDNNIALGQDAGGHYTSSESDNICIGNMGVLGESDTIRIGLNQTRNFQAGVTGVTVASSSPIAINSSGQISDLGFGTATQVLTSNGAGNSPTWQAAGGAATGFYAYANANIANVTGNSVTYTAQFNSTTRNDGTAFNTGTGLFTAPVTGLYHFSCTIALGSNSTFGGTTILIGYVGSVQSQRLYQVSPSTAANDTTIILPASWEVQMTAGDTMGVQAFSDTALQDVSLFGGAISSGAFNVNSSFSGYLVGS